MPCETPIAPEGEAAKLGSAFHVWAESIFEDEPADVPEIADRYGVDPDELHRLAAYAYTAWRDIKDYFTPASQAEVSFEGTAKSHPEYHFTGSTDRLEVQLEPTSPDPPWACVLDWKTGRVEGSYEQQFRQYAWLVCMKYPEVQVVHVIACYVQLKFWETHTYTREQLTTWHEDFLRRLDNGIGRYQPGDHCEFCPRRCTCPGAREYSRNAIETMSDIPLEQLTVENRDELGPAYNECYRKVQHIMKRCEEFKASIKQLVHDVGGIPDGKGKMLGITETNRRSLDPMNAWPILQQYMSDAEIAEATKISLKKCQDTVAARTSGAKGEARKQLLRALEGAEAVRVKTTESMREMKAPLHKGATEQEAS
jgi:hypothetical protein